ALASRALRSSGSTERSPCSARFRSRASSSCTRCRSVSRYSLGVTASPPCSSIVLVIARSDKGSPGEKVRQPTQGPQGGLGLMTASLLSFKFAGGDYVLQFTQVVGRRCKIGHWACAYIATHWPPGDPLAPIIVTLRTELRPWHLHYAPSRAPHRDILPRITNPQQTGGRSRRVYSGYEQGATGFRLRTRCKCNRRPATNKE